MSTDLAAVTPPPVVTPDRETGGHLSLAEGLAARALLGADCSQQRVSDLFGVSRRTIGRLADADLGAALRDPQRLEQARTCLADTASRGTTAEERETATTWLTAAAREAHQGEQTVVSFVHERTKLTKATASPRKASSRGRKARGHTRRPRRPHAGTSPVTPPAPRPSPDRAGAVAHVEALRRQQQRILHRSALLDYVLAEEQRRGAPLTMGAALVELIAADITEAARTIGTLLPPTNGRP